MRKSVCILGGGIVGFSTAVLVKERLPDVDAVIIAENVATGTTSEAAAGVFRPGDNLTGPTPYITERWIIDSWHHYNKFLKDDPSFAASIGIIPCPLYSFSNKSADYVTNRYLEDLSSEHRDMTEEERQITPRSFKYARFYQTIVIEPQYYMQFLRKRFIDLGGSIKQMKIESFEDVPKESTFDVVVNCTGIGAKKLCRDDLLVPVRGQVMKVRAPWIKYACYEDYDTYVIPGRDFITLGGVRDYSSMETTVDTYQSESIWGRCTKMLPSLKKAKVEKVVVGFRPQRIPVRVETGVYRMSNGATLNIVHNYGHGGFGVTTAPGTAFHAFCLIKELLNNAKF